MNRTGCVDPLLAMNQILIVSESCDVNFASYVAWLSILTTVKFLMAIAVSIDWWLKFSKQTAREAAIHDVDATYHWNALCRRRLPMTPIITVVLSMMYAIFTVVTATGICTANSGCPIALFAPMCLIYCFLNMVVLNRFIKLGRRVIPLSRAKLKNASDSSSSAAQTPVGDGDLLAKQDFALRVLFLLQYVLAFAPCIIGLPVQLLRPHSELLLYTQIFFGLQGAFIVCNMLGYLIQLERLIVATKLGCVKPFPPDVVNAIIKMRQMQAGINCLQVAASIGVFLIAANVLTPYWFALPIILTLETAGTLLNASIFTLSRIRRLMRRRAQKATPSAEGAKDKQASSTMERQNVTSDVKPTGYNSSFIMDDRLVTSMQ